VRHLLDRHVVFFAGKGGVGKTTCSAAFALAAARGGRRVLLVSTDPAHSTSDIFEQPFSAEERQVLPNLAGLEIDSAHEARRYLDEAKARMAGLFSPAVVKEAARQIELTAAMPGVADVALFDRMTDLVLARGGGYDLVVFDTAPTGHALQLLRMPELMVTWIDALARRRRDVAAAQAAGGEVEAGGAASDPVLEILERRAGRLRAMRSELCCADRVAVVLVLVPERLPIEETGRAVHLLEEAGLQPAGVVVNRVLPDGLPGDYFRSRSAQERTYRDEIDRRFGNLRRVTIPQFESDIHGLAGLEWVGQHLLADPARAR
jgi:arsenite-transporting ATPase